MSTSIDVTTLTLGEVARIEDLSGQSISSLDDITAPKGKALAALVLIFKRREELANGRTPKFSWNDAQSLTYTEAAEFLGLDDDESTADETAGEIATAGDVEPFEVAPKA
ncbi:hypothetical protein [Agromyces sp. S2-1-8]|uniref:hypothetical protein n=1 Tax=Agromyces sp. S2-1-8 TaxID=2897180 RepID=UPI001E42C417|nr:hypothetical protein [Agromyces sp. S2-1-8]MCD5345050.1 hypothetical protein [Agromyces sp. S2-1-8]